MKFRSLLSLRWSLSGSHRPLKGSFAVRIATSFAKTSKSRAHEGGFFRAAPAHAHHRAPLPTEEEIRDLF